MSEITGPDIEATYQFVPAPTRSTVLRLTFFKDRKKEWRWNLKSRNGKIVACSCEGYKREATAKKMASKIIAIIRLGTIS